MMKTFRHWGVFAMIPLTGLLAAGASALPRNALPRQTPTVPAFSHVIIVMIENKEFGDVIGNPGMPNFNRWAGEYAVLTRYYAVSHPSLPNYLALIGGDLFGIQTDCTDCFVNARSLPDLLEERGRTWKAYIEGLPKAGFLGSYSGRYAMKHNPFVYFEPIRRDPERLRRGVVPIAQLASDLEKKTLPDYAFIVPDMCNSAHDCGLEVADRWLGKHVGLILGSPAFDANCLVVLTFDEGRTVEGCCGRPPRAGGGRVATVLVSPLVQAGLEDPTPYSHYSLLKTVLKSWDLEDLGKTSDPSVAVILAPWKDRGDSRVP
ncbi:MAG: alkaline phosphatase family protein [Candidatus Aminicenantales bacterium]